MELSVPRFRVLRGRIWRSAGTIGALVVLVAGPVLASAEDQFDWGSPSQPLTALFAPRAAPPGAYRVLLSRDRIEDVARRMGAAAGGTPWSVQAAGLTDAYGVEGVYDRAKLARLLNGGRIRLARGTIERDGETVAYTLITPVPDPSLSRFVAGTMIIEFHVTRLLSAIGSANAGRNEDAASR